MDPIDYIAYVMAYPGDVGVTDKRVIGGGIEVYCVGPTPEYKPDNPRTDTLLRLENSFQVNGSDIDGKCHGNPTGWTIDASIITTNGSVASPSTYVVVLKPLIFG